MAYRVNDSVCVAKDSMGHTSTLEHYSTNMVASGSIQITGSITGLAVGSVVIGPLTVTLPAPKNVSYQPVLTTGANGPYLVPALSTYVLIVFPATNVAVVTLKGATGGDVGIPINGTVPSLIGLDPSATAINLNVSSPIPSGCELSFY